MSVIFVTLIIITFNIQMNADQLAQFEQGWAMMDLNGDGFLVKSEVKEFFTTNVGGMMKAFGATEAEIEAACEEAWKGVEVMDTNHDGKVSKQEMLEYMEKHGAPK